MIGAIIGDIAGSRFEFNNTTAYDFELMHSSCDYTDDSILTVAVADALLTGDEYADCLRRWARRYPHPMGAYGSSFSRWMWSDEPAYGSFGNGAAMRVSPVGWAFEEESEVIRVAMRSAEPTHNHREGLIGAAVIALAIHRLRHGATNDDIRALTTSAYGTDYQSRLPRRGVFDETCQGCVPLSLHLLTEATSFEDAVRRAIVYGGDSDTVGDIVGGLAEARFGVPTELVAAAISRLPDDMRAVVKAFRAKYVTA